KRHHSELLLRLSDHRWLPRLNGTCCSPIYVGSPSIKEKVISVVQIPLGTSDSKSECVSSKRSVVPQPPCRASTAFFQLSSSLRWCPAIAPITQSRSIVASGSSACNSSTAHFRIPCDQQQCAQ